MRKLQTNLVILSLIVVSACVAQSKTAADPDPSQDFADYCVACHGAGGKGDGPLAADLAKAPADLTGLSKRNGGEFPTTRVMAQIWGYAGGKGRGIMPDFAPLMEGDLVPYDGGDGIETPTPVRLVAIAEYLKGLQK